MSQLSILCFYYNGGNTFPYMSTCSGFYSPQSFLSYWLNDPFTNCIIAWCEYVEKCFCEQVYCIYMLWNADVFRNEWVMEWDILPLINVTQDTGLLHTNIIFTGLFWSLLVRHSVSIGNIKPFWTLHVSLFKVKPGVSFCRVHFIL